MMARIHAYGFEEGSIDDLYTEERQKRTERGELEKWSLFDFLFKYSSDSTLLGEPSGDVIITSGDHTFHFEMNPDNFMEWKLSIK